MLRPHLQIRVATLANHNSGPTPFVVTKWAPTKAYHMPNILSTLIFKLCAIFCIALCASLSIATLETFILL